MTGHGAIVRALALPVAAGLGIGIAVQAHAQDASVHHAMRNRIGLLAYCQQAGLLTAAETGAATARIQRAIGTLPAANKTSGGDEAEAKGRRGQWGSRGMPIETRAAAFSLSVKAYCAELAE